MGPAEIFWRVRHRCTILFERTAFRFRCYDWTASTWQRRLCRNADVTLPPNMAADWWQSHMRNREEPPFLLGRDVLDQAVPLFKQLFPGRLESVVEEADRYCRGEFDFLGARFQTESTVDWQRDPVTQRSWPSTFFADVRIPFCEGAAGQRAPGDSKHVWELNRHEFLVSCAKAYYLTGDERYARHVVRMVIDWVTSNPYLQGINWAGPLEVALRSMAWLWAYQLCRRSSGLSAEEHYIWIKAFYLHGCYLERHLEVYSSPNNHLVGEAAALYLIGSFFPEFDRAGAWQMRAWQILETQPERQFYEDGGSTEQATSYHHYCLGFFVLVVLTRLRQKLPVPASMLERLQSAFEFSMWMTAPDGTVPRIGDTDDARSIRFGPFIPWDFRNLLSIGAVMFRRGDFKAVSASFSEDALWLLGASGLETFQKLSISPPADTVRLFPSSGYAMLRDGWQCEGHHACIDCGEIGLGLRENDIPIFTHGHADMLSVWISSFGQPLLIDAGFFTYNGSPEWHRYTRDVSGHNTVRLDGQSQAKLHAKNAWACASRPGALSLESRAGFVWVEGSHSGFVGVNDCTRHRRAIAWNRESCWLIVDRLEGTGWHDIEVFFHFAPGHLSVNPEGGSVSVITNRGVYAVLQSAGSHTLEIEGLVGRGEPEGGWSASGYGAKEPAPVVRFHGRLQLPCTLSFALTAFPEPTSSPIIERYELLRNHPGTLVDSVRIRVVAATGKELLHIGQAKLDAALAPGGD